MFLALFKSLISLGLLFVTSSAISLEAEKDDAISYWAKEFSNSSLSHQDVLKELRWFQEAAANFKGRSIKSVSENIKTHQWERDVLTKAFYDITGVKVQHDIYGEGTVVDLLMKQLTSGRSYYDIYVSDADLIGTHMRMDAVVNLSHYMKNKGRNYTNPLLDLSDFLNLEFSKTADGSQLQLPDQQFANLYWFRHDWFSRNDIKKQFRKFTEKKYGSVNGYDLGVPTNWAAYEDIAEFFSKTLVDGKKVYGHLDYGKKSPSLGWRFTDSWLAIAGVGDKGLPNGRPVDEWGIRVEDNIPVGSSVSRGGAVNSPAAIYALDKYVEWLKKYAPPEALSWRWEDAGPVAARGDIAQRIFQYITWLSDDRFVDPEGNMIDEHGLPVWRVAPTPHGRYWEKGMKVGYQDAGSWTIPKSTKGPKRDLAWLWAQFCVSKTVSVNKFIAGGTPVRHSTLQSDFVQANKARWGGVVEFYTSGQEELWTDTGLNVPHYPRLSKVWWPQISKAINNEISTTEAMDNIAQQQDSILAQLNMAKFSPRLSAEKSEDYWLGRSGAPKRKRDREKPETIDYELLLKTWVKR